MRILITNDDGVFAPGIGALARGVLDAVGSDHELVIVAPLVDHSGAGAAVGPVYDRESIPYEAVDLPGLSSVPTYGVDGPPALAVIVACIEGFGPRPDLVLSGINHGINAGRSALHSGTVGAALTGAQFGLSGLAVSIGWGNHPVPWETPVALATSLIPLLAEQPPATVLNLNTPAVPLSELLGLRHGTLGAAGMIRSVRPESTPAPVEGTPIDRTSGVVSLALRGVGVATDRLAEQAELETGSDAWLLAQGWASVTALTGVREDLSETSQEAVRRAVAFHRQRQTGSI